MCTFLQIFSRDIINTRRFTTSQIHNPISSLKYTVKSFCEFINKLIEIFHWIMVSMITLLKTVFFFVDLQWIALYWSEKLITNNNKYNEFYDKPASIKIQCIFAWLFFTVYFHTTAFFSHFKFQPAFQHSYILFLIIYLKNYDNIYLLL